MKFGIPTLTRPCQVQPHASPLPSPRASLPRTPECAPPWTAAHAPHPGWLLQAWSRALPQDQPRPSSSRPALISVTRERPSVTMCSSGPPPESHIHEEKGGSALWRPHCWDPGPGLDRTSLLPCPSWAQAALDQPWRQRTALGCPHHIPTPSVFSSRLTFLRLEWLEITWDFFFVRREAR